MRSAEIKSLKFKDVSEVKRTFLESGSTTTRTVGYNCFISHSKTDKLSEGFYFFIPFESNNYYNPGMIIQNYIKEIIKANLFSNEREFLVPTKCKNPKKKDLTKVFFKGNVGKNRLAKFPIYIAKSLNLDYSKFTGHFFRRQGATMYAESGVCLDNLKRIGRWKSDNVASSYIYNSMKFKEQQ